MIQSLPHLTSNGASSPSIKLVLIKKFFVHFNQRLPIIAPIRKDVPEERIQKQLKLKEHVAYYETSIKSVVLMELFSKQVDTK